MYINTANHTFCFLTDSGMEKCLGSSSKVTAGISSWGSHNTATAKERAGVGVEQRERERGEERREEKRREEKRREGERESQNIII